MDSEEVLSILFSFVGVGHFLYVAGVSRSWRMHYTTKANAESGTLVTSIRDAVAAIPTLKYAYANGLKFTSDFHPRKNDFGRGLYKWARRHGVPLLVCVASESTYNDARVRISDRVIGVFSSARKAKSTALVRQNVSRKNAVWEVSSSGSLNHVIKHGDGSHTTIVVKTLEVDGLKYADEIHPLPLYVTSSTDLHCSPKISIEGVFPTMKLANQWTRKLETPPYKGSTHVENGFIHYYCGLSERTTVWEGYLDGEGGRPGTFLKPGRRMGAR